jgi:hypothetical protein
MSVYTEMLREEIGDREDYLLPEITIPVFRTVHQMLEDNEGALLVPWIGRHLGPEAHRAYAYGESRTHKANQRPAMQAGALTKFLGKNQKRENANVALRINIKSQQALHLLRMIYGPVVTLENTGDRVSPTSSLFYLEPEPLMEYIRANSFVRPETNGEFQTRLNRAKPNARAAGILQGKVAVLSLRDRLLTL